MNIHGVIQLSKDDVTRFLRNMSRHFFECFLKLAGCFKFGADTNYTLKEQFNKEGRFAATDGNVSIA